MSNPETIMIDDTKYVRADSVEVGEPLIRPDGLSYCVVRGYKMGVVCGWVDYEEVNNEVVEIFEGRQMYRWDSAFVLADLATSGVRKASECKFSEPSVVQKGVDVCQVFLCTKKAAKSLQAVPNANR